MTILLFCLVILISEVFFPLLDLFAEDYALYVRFCLLASL